MMNTRTISSEHILLTYSLRPFAIDRIENPRTGELLASNCKQTLLIRTPHELFEPVLLTRLRSARADGEVIRLRLSDESGAYTAELEARGGQTGIRFVLTARAPKPLWLVEWRLSGVRARRMIVPALGGQSLSEAMPEETTLSYKYPFWWNAQFAIAETAAGGLWIHAQEREPRLKMLRVRRESGQFTITYGVEAQAPLVQRTLRAEWLIDGYEGDWRRPVDEHRRWLAEAFSLTPLAEHPHMPAWARSVDFVLELWGITKEKEEPLHTFAMMADRLREFQNLHDPRRTLLYLPGFAMHGIDSHAPDYDPSAALGGGAGFKRLVSHAHRMGYRVMAHTNVLAMTFAHRLYKRFKRHQVIDCFGRTQGWGLDMDGDWLAEPYFAYINPGARAWTDLMRQVIGKLITAYGVDAVFLDQTLLAFNVSRGPNFLTGMREHVERLQRAFPAVLFAGEGLHEHVLRPLPFAQIHGIDSVAEVHGMEGQTPWRKAHPVSTYLFGPYTRFVAHLLTKHPSHPMFQHQEAAYAELGVVPALCLYNHRQAMDMPETRAMISRSLELAEHWKENP